MLKKLSLLACTLLIALTASAQGVERPKIVVGLVVDQMRWDYLYHYRDSYGEGGLRRLVDEGFSCENTMINYLPTVTAIGHTSVYTGSVPALHGIAGNNFIEDGVNKSSCGDETVQTVGSNTNKGQSSPHNLLAATIGDELKLATDFKARVYGVAIKDRAAILPAGHAANGAFWWDKKAGNFVTSTYYMDRL
ncbi:MAG: alkaline phosphatase family protein, partial [Muribaculaceae bacterium]|nr:alkaline phosphatase family protein [Muribaculaceae bacterium]